jgi:hypothetical protein
VRFFLDAFGPWRGRFLAEYPRKWRKMVYSALDCPNVEKSRIEERLRRLDARVFISRSTDSYDGTKPWLDNAEAEHARKPFRAVIASETRGKPYILDAAVIGEDEPLWTTPHGEMLVREPRVFASALRLLLSLSSRVVLIDPYFRSGSPDKTAPLVEFCKLLSGFSTAMEVHFATECDERTLDQDERDRQHARHFSWCMNEAARVLPDALPAGITVGMRGWKERAGGARLHNRYLITEIGGVQFGDGIERGATGHQDRVSILDEPSRNTLLNQYIGNPAAFDLVGERASRWRIRLSSTWAS